MGSIYDDDSPKNAGVIAGVSVGGAALLCTLLWFGRRKMATRRSALDFPLSQRGTQLSVLPIHNNNRAVRTVRRQSTELAEGLPAYDESRTDQLVAAIDLLSSITHADFEGRPGSSQSVEAGDSREHSAEMPRINQLRRGIAALVEVYHLTGPNPESGASASQMYPPTSTLRHRMLEVERLLSQLDDLASREGSLEETQNVMRDLRAQMALSLMDLSNEPIIPGLSIPESSGSLTSAPLSFPEPVQSVPSRQSADSPQDADGRREESRVGGVQDEPPPYHTVAGMSEDSRIAQAVPSAA